MNGTKPSLWKRLFHGAGTWWPNSLAAGGAVLLGLLGAFSVAPLAAAIGAIMSLLGQFGIFRKTRRQEDLQARLVAAERARDLSVGEIQLILDAELEHIGDLLDFHSSERISLFVPAEGAGLRLVARCSQNRDRTLGPKSRELYREDEGCLGVAWKEGEKYFTDLPSRVTDEAGWIARQSQLGVRAPNELKMPTRTYGCFRLQLEGGAHQGVIVFESESTPTLYSEQRAYKAPKLGREKLKETVRDETRPLCAIARAARLLPHTPPTGQP